MTNANIYNSQDPSIVNRVRSLNKLVLDWSVPRIISNIEQYERYKKDINFLLLLNNQQKYYIQ